MCDFLSHLQLWWFVVISRNLTGLFGDIDEIELQSHKQRKTNGIARK